MGDKEDWGRGRTHIGLTLDSLGLTWTHLDSIGLTWTHLISFEFTWTHLDSLDLSWTHLDSLGLTLIPLISLISREREHLISQGKREEISGAKAKREKGWESISSNRLPRKGPTLASQAGYHRRLGG